MSSWWFARPLPIEADRAFRIRLRNEKSRCADNIVNLIRPRWAFFDTAAPVPFDWVTSKNVCRCPISRKADTALPLFTCEVEIRSRSVMSFHEITAGTEAEESA